MLTCSFKQITGRDSHARGSLRDKIRPHITATYGFLTDGSERSKVKNKERYNYLLDRDAAEPEPVFHYKVSLSLYVGFHTLLNTGLLIPCYRTSNRVPFLATTPLFDKHFKSNGLQMRRALGSSI